MFSVVRELVLLCVTRCPSDILSWRELAKGDTVFLCARRPVHVHRVGLITDRVVCCSSQNNEQPVGDAPRLAGVVEIFNAQFS